MTMDMKPTRPRGIVAIDAEMARQHGDTLETFTANRARAAEVAASIRKSGRLLMLGMGASHAVGRMVEPIYRRLGIEAIALPLSEQLYQPLALTGRTVLVASQSGESAEVHRLFESQPPHAETYGLTMSPDSFLAQTVPSLIGAGGGEVAFAGTRSLTVTLAMHMAILAELGEDVAPAIARLSTPESPDVETAVRHFAKVGAIATSGRALQGVAEALALGLAELSRIPCFSHEGGQLRHGPMEMLGPHIGVVLLRGAEPTAELVAGLARSVAEAGSPVVVLDASGDAPVTGNGIVSIPAAAGGGLAAIFALLPVAQSFMVEFALSRVADAGTPVRSSKITRSE